MKPYYQDGAVTIYHGDSRELACGLEFDVLLTDPPYGIDHPVDYGSRGRGKLAAARDYPAIAGDVEPFDPAWLLALNKPTLMFGANHYASRLPDSSGWIVWDKKRPEGLDQATAELAWTNFVKGVRVFRYLWNGMLRDGNEVLDHPMMKPAALWRWVIGLKWTPPGVIFDPYMGSGNVLRAAKDLGRPAIGVELKEAYCELAALKMGQEVLL